MAIAVPGYLKGTRRVLDIPREDARLVVVVKKVRGRDEATGKVRVGKL